MCTLLTLPTAYAQENHKNEVGLLLGATVNPELNLAGPSGAAIKTGAGITFQATYARELAKRGPAAIYFELPFVAIPLQDVRSADGTVPANYASLFVTPGLRVKFKPDAVLSPWLSAGGGYALFDVSARRIDGTPNPATLSTNRGAIQFGGGVDIRTPIKVLFPVGIRVEARDFYSGKPNYTVGTGGGFQHNVVFSGGLAVHF
jgi:hypothetical protein